MRFRPSAIGLVVLTAAAVPARAQFSFDARRIGMAGVSMHRDGDLQRYNAAYRAAPKGKNDQGGFTIPIPLGIIQALKDSNITFNTKDSNFNAIAIANLILNPPIFYQIKKPPTPTNDIAIGVGKDSLQIDLGLAKTLIPQDRFAFGGSSRLMDIGFGIKGLRLSVFAFIEEDIGADLSDSLRAFLRDGHQAHDTTSYDLLPSGRAQAGFAPSLGWAGKIAGPDPDHGLYFGANILNSGRGTTVHVGAEKRVGPFAVRGGVARDRRKQIQFGWGGGVRLGFLGLDVGFATTSQNLSSERGIVMATSLTIY